MSFLGRDGDSLDFFRVQEMDVIRGMGTAVYNGMP